MHAPGPSGVCRKTDTPPGKHMNKSMIIGVATGVVGAAGAGALATGKLTLGPTYAEVLSVTPVTQTVTTPRQQCHQEQVTVRKKKDPHNIAGTAVGAVVGGIVFNAIGGGVIKALATTAGVIGGGYAGNRIENSVNKGGTKTVTKERCVTAYDRTTTPNGYEVTYSFKGKTQVVHMDYDPGKQILLKDGKLDLSAYSPNRSGQQGQYPGQSPNAAPPNGNLGPTGSPDPGPNANQAPSQDGRAG